jgi:hypothetical protein
MLLGICTVWNWANKGKQAHSWAYNRALATSILQVWAVITCIYIYTYMLPLHPPSVYAVITGRPSVEVSIAYNPEAQRAASQGRRLLQAGSDQDQLIAAVFPIAVGALPGVHVVPASTAANWAMRCIMLQGDQQQALRKGACWSPADGGLSALLPLCWCTRAMLPQQRLA